MDEILEKLKQDGKNTVDSIIQWMKDTKLIDNSKEAEAKACSLFADCKDASNVQFDEFKQAVAKLAEEKHQSLEQFTEMLSTQGPKLLSAVKAGAAAGAAAGAGAAVSAFKETFEK